MKKRLLAAILLGMSITIMSGISAMANETQQNVVAESETFTSNSKSNDGVTAERGVIGKKKTVKKNYRSIEAIPAAIYYEEYINGAWYSGDLEWTGEAKVIGSTGLYEATFEGIIYK